jgi:hypothetical protein
LVYEALHIVGKGLDNGRKDKMVMNVIPVLTPRFNPNITIAFVDLKGAVSM